MAGTKNYIVSAQNWLKLNLPSLVPYSFSKWLSIVFWSFVRFCRPTLAECLTRIANCFNSISLSVIFCPFQNFYSLTVAIWGRAICCFGKQFWVLMDVAKLFRKDICCVYCREANKSLLSRFLIYCFEPKTTIFEDYLSNCSKNIK